MLLPALVAVRYGEVVVSPRDSRPLSHIPRRRQVVLRSGLVVAEFVPVMLKSLHLAGPKDA